MIYEFDKKERFSMTDYYYPVLSDEVNLPLYVLGVGARDREIGRAHV